MSRHVVTFKVNQPAEWVNSTVTEFFRVNGYEKDTHKGAHVWRRGMGVMTAPRFMEISYLNGEVKIEAWLAVPLLPGVFVGELGVKGFYAFPLKSMLKGEVQSLSRILQASASPAEQPPAQA